MPYLDHDKELLDVVNQNDEVVDVKSKTEVHQLGLLHREIHVWMFDENKNIYFQRMGLHKKSAGLLDGTVGGHVDKGETYIEAAVRETKEETDIYINDPDLILLKKVRRISPKKGTSGEEVVNNFIRAVYIYKKPVDEKMLKKEEKMQGGGFQKLSYELLKNMPGEYKKMIKEFVLINEIPDVLEYLHTWKN